AQEWNQDFDGNKLILMASECDVHALQEVLCEVLEEDIPLEWRFGTVKYRIYGYGMGPPWMGYQWNDEDEHPKMTLDTYPDVTDFDDCDRYEVDDCYDEMHDDDDYDDGDMTINASSEMVPSGYFDAMEYDEVFENTYHAVLGKRKFDMERAIVVWPKAGNWSVLANGDFDAMCEHVLAENPEAAKVKVRALSEDVVGRNFGHDDSKRERDVSRMMQVLMRVNDRD
ncbi:MAG: hypothetical protein SGILL_009333, partial [Bacillariaceae sp.]